MNDGHLYKPVWLARGVVLVWALCFGLTLNAVTSGTPVPPMFVAGDRAGGYPTVVHFRTELPNAKMELAPGDRLLRMGDVDLTGIGALGIFAVAAEAGRADDEVRVDYERAGASGSTQIRFGSLMPVWGMMPVGLAWGFLSLIVWRRSQWSRASRDACFASAGFSVMCVSVFSGSYPEIMLSAVVESLASAVAIVFALLFATSFPGPASAAPPRWPWLFLSVAPLQASRIYGWGLPPQFGAPAFVATTVLALVVGIVILVGKYGRASAVERRQITVLLLGASTLVSCFAFAAGLVAYDGRFTTFYRVVQVCVGVLAAGIIIAIFRYGTFSVGRALNASAAYAFAVAAFVAIGLAAMPRLAASLAGWFGTDPWVGQAVLALGIAVVALPAVRYLRPRFDRIFFPGRDNLQLGFDRLTSEITRCDTVEEVMLTTGTGLDALLQAKCVAIYVCAADDMSRVISLGRQAPLRWRDATGLIGALERRQQVVLYEDLRSSPELSSAEHAVLEDLRAALLLPLHRHGKLVAVAILSDKSSGEAYALAEIILLGALREALSATLLRFDEANMTAIGEEMARLMHDLKSPLSLAMGYTHMLAKADTAEREAQLGRAVLEQFERIQRMASDVLAYARGESELLVAKVKVNQFLDRLRGQLEPELDARNVQLVVEPEYRDIAFFDEAQIVRAVANLARNAAEAMPAGGTFRIATGSENGRFIIVCADDGPGVPPEMEGQLFDTFATAGKQGGTGLGLATVKAVVDRHHGTIRVRSRPGQGTTFTIELPLQP